MPLRSSLLAGLLAVVASTAFGTTTLLTGCSGGSGSGSDEPAAVPDITATQLDSQTTQMFASPGANEGVIESTLPGVTTWTFYASQAGVVVVGADASGAEKVKIAAIVDGDMNFIASGFSHSTDITATPQTIAETLNKDIQAQVPEDEESGDVQSRSLHTDGLVTSSGAPLVDAGKPLVDAGKSLVQRCGTTLLRAVGGALVSAAGVAGGALLATTCETGVGCVAAGYVARTAVVSGIGIACPNLPIGIGGLVKTTPAM